MKKSGKLTWLLILQAWTMLWVVIGHAPLDEPPTDGINLSMHKIAEALFTFAYSFHMPLFIMISGYLFYRTRVKRGWKYLEMVKEKWLRLGIPYIFFISIGIVIKLCFSGNIQRSVDTSPTGLIMNYLDPFNGALQEMWFVAVIFLYFLLYPAYRYMLKSKLTTTLSICMGVLMYFIPTQTLPGLLAFNRAVHFFIFFFLGLSISRWELESRIEDWRVIIACMCGYAISYYFSISLLKAIFASAGFWGVAMKADKVLTSNLFHSFREYTYQIFLIGIFVQIFVKILARRFVFPGSYPVWWMVCVLLGIYIPVLLAKIPGLKDNRIYKRLIGI